MANYSDEIKDAAKILYLKRWSPKDIAEQLNLNCARVVYNWANKGNWPAMLQHETVEQAIGRQIIVLADKEDKTDHDLKVMDRLINQLDKLAGIEKKKAQILREKSRVHTESSSSSGDKKSTKKRKANDISNITKEQLEKIRKKLFFGYQQRWHDHKSERTRFILKSRQIGATFYFAWEAFEDAVLTGDNQVFLSASKSQAHIFKAYIISFAKDYFDIELKGDTIKLSNGAELRFVSTNASTAQGYNGHLYIDEVFWIPSFEKLNDLAGGMAAHDKWRRTYFSTPSIKSHSAYPLWSGQRYNENKRKDYEFDLSHKKLRTGHKGKDSIWRNIVTVEDAKEQGCKLFNIERLRDENSEATFNNLFMCAFLEAGLSVFNLNDLMSCAVDSNVTWVDFNKKQIRPYGNIPVWIGYDPARRGDNSTVVVIAPPLSEKSKFRVLEKINLKGSFPHQARSIQKLFEKYNVQFMGIDCTGPGLGVYDMVKEFYRKVTPIHYSLEAKTSLVLKGMDVIENRRIEWDEEHKEIPQAFLQIQQKTTSNDKITYAADRTSELGHADVAFAILHALSHEPLTRRKRKASVGF